MILPGNPGRMLEPSRCTQKDMRFSGTYVAVSEDSRLSRKSDLLNSAERPPSSSAHALAKVRESRRSAARKSF